MILNQTSSDNSREEYIPSQHKKLILLLLGLVVISAFKYGTETTAKDIDVYPKTKKAADYVTIKTKSSLPSDEEVRFEQIRPEQKKMTMQLGEMDSHGFAQETKVNTNFTFPSVNERVNYYMGDWHISKGAKFDPFHYNNNFLLDNEQSLASLCPGDDQNIVLQRWNLFGLSTLSSCLQNTRQENRCKSMLPMISPYLRISTLRPLVDHNYMVLCRFGDTYSSEEVRVPVITKTRLVEGIQIKNAADTGIHTSPILWPLDPKRHYGPIFKNKKLLQSTPFDEKKDTLIWRGVPTGYIGFEEYGRLPRTEIVQKWHDYPNRQDIDVAFVRDSNMTRSSINANEYVKYKYLLSLEGNDVASGLKWMLYPNSVVFMAKPNWATWVMEDKLVPFYHYIPVKDDYSDLNKMLHWAREHEEECKNIAKRSTEYMERLVLTEQADEENAAIMKSMQEMYVHLGYGEQYRKFCKKKRHKKKGRNMNEK